jgi:hypothetical protein
MKNIKISIIVSTILVFVLSSCAGEQTRKKTPNELRYELQQQELSKPLDYVSVENVKLYPQTKEVRKARLFKKAKYEDNGAVIEGYIVNKASLAKFKDVALKVTYYSKTNTIIYEKTFIFYEYYNPNSTKDFSLKVYPPKGSNTFKVEVINAKGE